MEEVNITELESRYYMDLFLCCDIEKTGKVPVLKATEMFRSAEISNDILRHIMSLAAIPQTALHMSRVQFYSCLKLIAAHQSSVPLRKELIASSVTLPLPKFSWKESPVEGGSTTIESSNGVNVTGDDRKKWRNTNASRSPDLIELARVDTKSDVINSDITSTDSEVEQKDSQRKNARRDGSPEAWSTASDSPTPTNSVAERPWAQTTLWQGLLCEEQRQLLGTEEESSDRHSSEEDNETDLETIYQITTEQKEYYTKQFRAVQPDLDNGLLSGHIAKVFFEKSRIPVEELRHIWQLCDVTKDGALSLDEFTAAMHLVVLRRNNIPLPPILPACLMPPNKRPDITEPAEADLLHLNDDKPDGNIASNQTSNSDLSQTCINNYAKHATSNSPSNVRSTATSVTHNEKINSKTKSNSKSPPNESVTPPLKSKCAAGSEWINQSSKEWTKFTESPTSTVSSPGPKPVNFDMQRTVQAVGSDPQILHPVPLRITPVGAETVDDETSRVVRKSDNLVYDGGIITIRDSDNDSPKYHSSHRDSGPQNDLRAIQRPQPKKIPVKNNVGAIPPPPQRAGPSSNGIDSSLNTTAPTLGSKKEAPPPPPRPHRHARSSSLDLNKLKLNAPVPPVPPRVSPQMTAQISLDAQLDVVNSQFADFTHFPESVVEASGGKSDADRNGPSTSRATIHNIQTSQRSSAFEVYRKPNYRESISPPDPLTTAILAKDSSSTTTNDRDSLRYVSYMQEKGLGDVMRHLKEQNVLLMTLCNDLSDELVTVQHKKKEIKAKIDNQTQATNSNEDNLNQSTV